jgi:hypothetical protein
VKGKEIELIQKKGTTQWPRLKETALLSESQWKVRQKLDLERVGHFPGSGLNEWTVHNVVTPAGKVQLKGDK